MGKKKSISAQGSNNDGDSGCSGFSSPLLLLLLPLLLLLRLTTTNNSTALGTVTWWLLVATVTHARARMRQRQRSRGGGGGVVVCAVGVFLFAFRFVVLFSLRFVYSSACLLACACVRESELVGGALHTIRFGFLAALELWVAKNNHSLSLSFSLSASHSFSLLLTFVTCFSCCCIYLCRCRLLFYAHVAKKHTRRVAGSRQSETRVAFRCRQDRNLCLCMWNVCWLRLRLLSRSLTHSHTYTNWSICSLWFTTAFVCSILRLLIVSLFRSCSLSLHETERRICGKLVIAVGFCFSYSIWLSLHFSFNCYCLNAWKTN